ncbi:hypothetical protein TorRG33x02_248990 [Trema orientale]|uniref:Uncharacterized protein n=1 Tax=Trema orientale TaxID=63057 RepID=A0A2P5DK16_TREOI|nr:hypothetical protein TorRG33x02_248990 [Trema orientale]
MEVGDLTHKFIFMPFSKFPTLLPALFPSPSSPTFFTILSKYLSSSLSFSPLRFDPPHIPNLSLSLSLTYHNSKKRKKEKEKRIINKYTLKKRMLNSHRFSFVFSIPNCYTSVQHCLNIYTTHPPLFS